ncbi:MAG: hypothetical protein JW995_02325 [Melioribacteraceae bacterium]|nr:hypothetical protein [Melioribacteraceae bacterium]
MNKSMIRNFSVLLLMILSLPAVAQQIERGSATARRTGIHDGNQVKTVYNNSAVIAQPGNEGPRAAWKFRGNGYVGDVSPLVGVRLPIKDYNNNGVLDTLVSVVITSVSRPGGGDYSPGGGTFLGFEPIPGFFNPTVDTIGKGVAMSHQPETWPDYWPDQPAWKDEDGNTEWNGYFGRGQFNADQESYWWMDDNVDDKMFNRIGFLPDANDPTRKGQALRFTGRGLQWNNFLAQDVVFWLYEISNIGTETYDQTVFGTLVGTYVGAEGDEWNDDVSFFDIRQAITYSWDFDNYIRPSANPRWLPNPSEVGYIAYAFLESPGNQFDGIDNDGDNRSYTNAEYFTEDDFEARTVSAGEKVVLIDAGTFERSYFTLPSDTVTVVSMGKKYFIEPGVTQLVEGNMLVTNRGLQLNRNATDGLDNDLDGLIDENFQVHYRQYKEDNDGTVLIDTLNPVQYTNYIANINAYDIMIDEARNDDVDNDNDWNMEFDDVGQDGKPETNDFGEGDGLPTPGEPNFDRTDVDESDQIGLTSFQYFVPAGDIIMSDEDDLWTRLRPGLFDVPNSIVNGVAIRGEDGDFMYGSGYFPLLPGETERFSLALAFGPDFRGILKTKQTAQFIFDANYNFPKPPTAPVVTAVPGDGKVTLYWDKEAEESVDRTTKIKDFEGYKIYKGTDENFTDAFVLTNGFGDPTWWKPIAQYDLKNGIAGYFSPSAALNERASGLPYFLGDDTGIKNTFVDNDVINGRTYYYAVVAYDRGDETKDIYPSENGRSLDDPNVVVVTPNAHVAGFVPPESGLPLTRISGYSKQTPYFEVIDPFDVEEKTYEVIFLDEIINGTPIAYGYNVIDTQTGIEVFKEPQKLLPSNGSIFNGVSLAIDTTYQFLDSIRVDQKVSKWSNTAKQNLKYTVSKFVFAGYPDGIREAADYLFVFGPEFDKPTGNRLMGLPIGSKNTNFEIFNVTDRNNPVKVPFVFSSRTDNLSHLSRIIMTTADTSDLTWDITFVGDSTTVLPEAGDSLLISMKKPFTSADKFSFTVYPPDFDPNSLDEAIKRVKAVPNPYVVTNIFEQPLAGINTRGRGERIINFVNLPPNSTIQIFTSSGNHVRTLTNGSQLINGSLSWDLRTKEGLDVSFGVYFYIVEAEGTSQKKIGKLAIIK